MTAPITLEQVEELAAQLSPQDQLRLVAHIGEKLSMVSPASPHAGVARDSDPGSRLAQADALLARLDAIAESIEGEFDSAEDVRAVREDRTARL